VNKSFVTNLLAFLLIILGYFFHNEVILAVGLFAFSGALTNWLAVHMLFEKVPGLYGSGVVPARFEEFKAAIKTMMMEQFFTDENIDKFLTTAEGVKADLHLTPIIKKIDLTPAFDDLVEVIMASSFGGMLGMFGGQEALLPLKEPFVIKMKQSLSDITQTAEFSELLKSEIESPDVITDIKSKVSSIIEARLAELTPQLVKEIVQEMIKKHLGWLVVWGGVFGAIIGYLSTFIS